MHPEMMAPLLPDSVRMSREAERRHARLAAQRDARGPRLPRIRGFFAALALQDVPRRLPVIPGYDTRRPAI